MSSDATVGRIAFGPHPGSSSADPMPASYMQMMEERRHSALLIELIDADGVCLGLYWAGRSNRIEKGPRGVEVTYDVTKARRIPLSMRDVAEQLAEALNEYTSIPVEQLGRTWRAVEYAE